MTQALNKLVMLIIGMLLHIIATNEIPFVLPLLCALIATTSIEIFNKKYQPFLLFVFLLASTCVPYLYCYFPLFLYDICQREKSFWSTACLIVFSIFCSYPNTMSMITLLLSLCIAIITKHKHLQSALILETYRKQRDATKELTIMMQEKNQDILLKQDYEIRLATLNERNRIAREIHDNVGHLLSSSLLQIGAIRTINTNEPLDSSLCTLKSTVDSAMSSVRNSVHDLHEDALNLEIEMQKIIHDFTFAPITYSYDIDTKLPKDMIYHIVAIVKECLTNVIKHSNGNHVEITMHEHPNFYQVIIKDNGKIAKNTESNGIGLHNIEQRVQQYHGYLNIDKENGFCVFITLPKESIK